MSDVSRETPPVPPAVRGVFPSSALAGVERYAALLATEGVTRGLIGPREVPRLWERHLANCALPARVIPEGARVADVGSGAGLPGLVLALVRPDLQVTLIEPLLRRTTFLHEAVEHLGLAQVRVERARAEAWHGREQFDVVTSRAVAPLGRLVEWCLPLASPTGVVLAMKGESVAEEVAAADGLLTSLGAATPEVLVVGDRDGPQVRLVRVRWSEAAQVSWPVGPHAVSGDRAPGRRRRGRGVGT